MEAQSKITQKIRREAQERGETALELAQAMGVYPTTAERWLRGERVPQRRHRKELAEHWGLPLDAFEPKIELEDREVRDQLDRVEQALKLNGEKLDQVLSQLGVAPLQEEPAEPLERRIVDALRSSAG